MTRDILDKDGNTIGQLTLPDDTSEDVWTAKLAEYIAPPSTVIPPTLIDQATAAMNFGKQLIAQLGTEPEMNALTTDQMVSLINIAGPIQLMLMTGALGTALVAIQNTDFQSLLSADLINRYAGMIQDYIGSMP